jgi:uncharacterized membrane protein (UPF0127 family)
MKKKRIFVFVIAVLVIIIVMLFVFGKNKPQVCIKEKCFSVELAKTDEELSRGLMYRESLNEDRGMLFIFKNEAKHSFWMKNTLIALDIIWINKNGEIIYINKDTPICQFDPCTTYSSEKEALYVLEIGAEIVDKYGFNVGDEVKLKGIQ